MRDLLGNKILPGTLLWWITKALPIRVARIEEPSKLEMIGHPRSQRRRGLCWS